MLKRITRTIIYLVVLVGSMLAGAVLGSVLAFIVMIAARGAGHLDLSMLFVLGFNTIFIKIASVSMDGYKFGYIRAVLAPALAWYLLAMLLGKQHVFAGGHMYNAISSVVLVSFLYACSFVTKYIFKKIDFNPPDESTNCNESL